MVSGVERVGGGARKRGCYWEICGMLADQLVN